MNYFSTTHLVIYGFLLLTLLIGLYTGRNVKTFRDYATANRSLGAGVLTMTLLATLVSAGWVGQISFIYKKGLVMTMSVLPMLILSLSFLGEYLSNKLARFFHCFTMAQVMGELYGRNAVPITKKEAEQPQKALNTIQKLIVAAFYATIKIYTTHTCNRSSYSLLCAGRFSACLLY